jgi:hypothetical protein
VRDGRDVRQPAAGRPALLVIHRLRTHVHDEQRWPAHGGVPPGDLSGDVTGAALLAAGVVVARGYGAKQPVVCATLTVDCPKQLIRMNRHSGLNDEGARGRVGGRELFVVDARGHLG